MKKNILVSLIILMFYSFTYSQNLKISDFYICKDNKKIFLGDSLKQTCDNFDLDKFDIKLLGNMKYKVFSFSWGDVYTSDYSKEYTIFGVELKNSEACIIENLRVGDNKKTVLNKLGIPAREIDNIFYYYNDDFDVLELKIIFLEDKISKIVLFMGT